MSMKNFSALFFTLVHFVPISVGTTIRGLQKVWVPMADITVGAILAAQDRNYKIELGTRSSEISFEAFIALKLKDMGLIEEFEVQNIHQQVYEVKVKTKGSETWVNLLDVGFGISQVLPLLVQCFYAPEGSIILIDQPEVHLHPYAQSALADVMIDVIESKSNLRKRNIQLIIETHSEHFPPAIAKTNC